MHIGFVVVKYEGKRPFRRPRRRQANNIRKDLKEISWEGFDKVHLARDRYNWGILVRVVMNTQATSNGGNFLIS